MSEIRLICHPSTPPLKADHVDVEIRTAGNGRLFARYVVECELFVKRADQDRYFEYNFSPSTEWALYRFSDYRKGMAEEMVRRPRITCDYSESHFALNAEFDLPDGWRDRALMVGVAAVVEESEGNKSYWALAHPSDQPDFHHKDCFALPLDAPRVS